MKLTFLGAAETVTGSMTLLEANGAKILIDAGMFQGEHELEEQNLDSLPLSPKEIDHIVLTHSHLDHVGRLPLLVKNGFKGEIHATPATLDIARIILFDSQKVMEEEAEHLTRRKLRRGGEPVEPLYSTEDVFLTTALFGKGENYGEHFSLGGGISGVFRDAGHILGSAFLSLVVKENGAEKHLIFSGDLGNYDKPIVRDPEPPHLEDPIWTQIESTYGDRLHKSIKESVNELREAITDTFKAGGNVVIPSFALERAQDILYYLREFYEAGELPKCNVFLDSPLAISATNIFRMHKECYDEEAHELFREHKDPFQFPYLEFTRTVAASRKINEIKKNAIIIAGSGMCTGGRVKHHLKHNLWRKESSVIFVGFQAKGTLGRKIINGAEEVTIYGEPIAVKAKIYTINGFSSHADQQGLMGWLSRIKGNPTVGIVHGEPEAQEVLQKKIKEELGFKTKIPKYEETIEI